ncbi:MAG TPA: DUF1564 family protein [Leptospiraceae bacterium]|nr:DUF1564 family protein [Leptospiraceae bacterium]HMW04950.1 DUF1564 family protein [Leptospiraceae bacterium]HMX31901.1 DUF1564 family protein [Leptospiraceae bacterium]HMY30829.1 DUF1564 family protein [Leptospiraceae bacterium]HMZ64290.1 DUF1564 family protein [Leptospiraceae bacterium]
MILFENKSYRLDKQQTQFDKTTSSLLVPEHLIGILKRKIKENGSLKLYFKSLLFRYRSLNFSGILPIPRKVKTEYQNKGLDLIRISFRVDNCDWIELGSLALACGKSRCYLFVFLLELDTFGLTEIQSITDLNNVVATEANLSVESSWFLKRSTFLFERSFHIRV